MRIRYGWHEEIILSMVQTAEGRPIHPQIFAGTRALTIRKVLTRLVICCIVLVADRKLLPMNNLEEIGKIRLG